MPLHCRVATPAPRSCVAVEYHVSRLANASAHHAGLFKTNCHNSLTCLRLQGWPAVAHECLVADGFPWSG